MNIKRILSIVTALALSRTVIDTAFANPFNLDLSFNGTGKLETDLDPSAASYDGVNALAIQADGKIIAAGFAEGNDSDAALVRYHPNGTLDTSFGAGGIVKTHVTQHEGINDAVIQQDGKIVVTGSTDYGETDLFLARYLSDGSLDSGFGTGGIVITDLGGFEVANSVKLQADGKIVVAGQHQPAGSSFASDVLIAQYDQDGLLDVNFGNQGIVITDYNGKWDIAWDMDITHDGRITVVGSSWGPSFSNVRGILGRYLSNGAPDSTLNGGFIGCQYTNTCGKITTYLDSGFYSYGVALALRKADGSEDGKIIISGQFGLARYNYNGTLDTTFDGDGINHDSDTNIIEANSTGDDLAIRKDGRIIRIGKGGGNFNIAMYKHNGQRDDWCTGDITHATSFAAATAGPETVVIQPDGKILVAGSVNNQDQDFALVRYKGGKCGTITIGSSHDFEDFDTPRTIHKFVNPQDKVGPNWPGYSQRIDKLARTGDLLGPADLRENLRSD